MSTTLAPDPVNIGHIRTHVKALLSYESPLPLQESLIQFYRAIVSALQMLRGLGAMPAARTELVGSLMQNYEAVLDQIEAMDEAVNADNDRELVSALARLEANVLEIDRLLQQDRAQFPQ